MSLVPEPAPRDPEEHTVDPARDQRESRYLMDHGSSTAPSHVSFRPTGDRALRLPCEIVDLNTGGCAIHYRAPCPIPRSLAMVEINELKEIGALRTLCDVRWSRQIGLDSFRSGLRFRRPIDAELLRRGVMDGYLSRRGAPRKPVHIASTMRQNQPSTLFESTIVCVSETGAQVLTASPTMVGARLMLSLPDGTTVLGKSAWCATRKTQYASGIAFESLVSGSRFREQIDVIGKRDRR